MNKPCLCFRPGEGRGPFVENWNFFLMDRSIVDDPAVLDPSIQQVIPYVTFYRQVERQTEDGVKYISFELLAYSRGQESGEVRLVGNSSIGFGGHIDRLPGDNILELFHDEAKREIREELGIELNSNRLYAAIISCLRNNNLIMLNDGTVNAVHCALSLMLDINEHQGEQALKLEEGHIEKPRWIDVEAIQGEELTYYEGWSRVVIQGLQNLIRQMVDAERKKIAFLAQRSGVVDVEVKPQSEEGKQIEQSPIAAAATTAANEAGSDTAPDGETTVH
jgi:predicted NUDIX family phosphoesterase